MLTPWAFTSAASTRGRSYCLLWERNLGVVGFVFRMPREHQAQESRVSPGAVVLGLSLGWVLLAM